MFGILKGFLLLCLDDSTNEISEDTSRNMENVTDNDAPATSADAEDAEDGKETEDALQLLRSQVFTLTTSLSTVSEEKTKIVSSYQAEKRKLKVSLNNKIIYCTYIDAYIIYLLDRQQ